MKNLFILFLLVSVSFAAQTHRFIYDFQFRMNAADSTKTQTYYHLDINPDKTYYHERKYFIADSLVKAMLPLQFSGGMTDIFMKDRNTGKMSVFIYKGFDSFRLEDQPVQNWKILPDTKMLGNLKIQKAATTWSGRNWQAWFAPELPFQEGPHKFGGLPGLIVELADERDNFSFKLIRSEVIPQTYVLNTWYNSKYMMPVPISYERHKKMLMEYYKSPLKSLITKEIDFKNSPFITDEGRMIDSDQKFRDYEAEERSRIKKYNNPLELSLKIDYPEK